MNAINRVEDWGRSHPVWLDFLRVSLGVFLFIKGALFLGNTDNLLSIISTDFRGWSALALVHYIAFAHLFGGLMIALGLLTRIAIIVQIPILLGAIFFVNADQSIFSVYSELALSIIVFLVLVVFLIMGPGPHSVDNYYKTHRGVLP